MDVFLGAKAGLSATGTTRQAKRCRSVAAFSPDQWGRRNPGGRVAGTGGRCSNSSIVRTRSPAGRSQVSRAEPARNAGLECDTRTSAAPIGRRALCPTVPLMHRTRHFIAWFCLAASLWMGVGFQLHGLSHALHALEAAQAHEGVPGHLVACDQCLLFASVDSAMPLAGPVVPPAPAADTALACPRAECGASTFTAYVSRAPPAQA